MKRLALLPVTALLILISSTTCTQCPPITTSLADAVTEVPSLDGFEPKTVAPMRELPRGLQGGFLLMPGVWETGPSSHAPLSPRCRVAIS
jgi:hypothetical protein